MFTKIFNLSNLVLIVALSLSAIAAWYSIVGLIAIFAAAVIPIIIMGSALEVAKVVTTVWLHRYWDKLSWLYKIYLLPAVIVLAIITSMGIFGFLSKAHIDQGVPTGDIAAKVALIDEKIKTQRDNIDIARKALAQMDNQVDARLTRSDNEQGAERAVAIRRQQAGERTKLQKEISDAQQIISKLNEEKAPIASQLRQVEAEVGPIKYIAALIYGDNPDQSLLEKSVRYVIILLVIVFDPLALILVVASNTSRKWELSPEVENLIAPQSNDVDKEPLEPIDEPIEPVKEEPVEQVYLKKPWIDKVPGINVGPQVYKPEEPVVQEPEIINCNTCGSSLEKVGKLGLFCSNVDCPTYTVIEEIAEPLVEETPVIVPEIKVEGVTREKPYKELESGYILFDDKSMSKSAAMEMHPEWFMLTADSTSSVSTNFGSTFPKIATKGEIFVRVDVLPNRVFKFDGSKWIEVQKGNSDSYLYDKKYVEYLIKEIETGKYDVELLTETEKSLIEQYLKSQ